MKKKVKELLEIDRLLREFSSKKAQYLEAIGSSVIPQEALVRMEDDLDRLQRNIYAQDPYTRTRRYISRN
ncbi:MAG: hypothetical protein PVG55_04755 [Nitrospirota bacterium]